MRAIEDNGPDSLGAFRDLAEQRDAREVGADVVVEVRRDAGPDGGHFEDARNTIAINRENGAPVSNVASVRNHHRIQIGGRMVKTTAAGWLGGGTIRVNRANENPIRAGGEAREVDGPDPCWRRSSPQRCHQTGTDTRDFARTPTRAPRNRCRSDSVQEPGRPATRPLAPSADTGCGSPVTRTALMRALGAGPAASFVGTNRARPSDVPNQSTPVRSRKPVARRARRQTIGFREVFDATGFGIEPVDALASTGVQKALGVFDDRLGLIAGQSLSSAVGHERGACRVAVIHTNQAGAIRREPEPARTVEVNVPDGSGRQAFR